MVTVRYTFHFRLCAYFSIFQILLSSFVTVNTISHFVYLSLFICSSPIPLKGELVAFHLVCAYSKWFQTFSKCDSQTIRVPIYWWTCVGLSSRSSSSKHHIGGITSNGNNTTATKVWRYARIPVMNHLMTMESYLFIYLFSAAAATAAYRLILCQFESFNFMIQWLCRRWLQKAFIVCSIQWCYALEIQLKPPSGSTHCRQSSINKS